MADECTIREERDEYDDCVFVLRDADEYVIGIFNERKDFCCWRWRCSGWRSNWR